MKSDVEENNETGAGEAAGAPASSPWLFAVLGASTLLSLTFILVALLMLFDQQRPSNLRPYTVSLTAQIIQALEDQYVPRTKIQEGPLEDRQDASSLWTYQFIKAELPPHLNLDGLKRLLERRMSDLNIQVVERPLAGLGPALSMMLGPYEFATVELQPATPSETAVIDIRDAAFRLAQDLPQYMASSGVPEDQVSVGAPDDREDTRARWTQTRVDVALPDRVTVGELRARLQERLMAQGVEVVVPTGMPQALQLQLKGLPVVSIFTVPGSGEVSATAPRPMQLETMDLPETAIAPDIPESEELEPLEPAELDPLLETLGTSAPTMADGPDYSALNSRSLDTFPAGNAFEGAGIAASPSRVAIILDDGGNVWARTEEVLALDNRLTLAILPHTAFAAKTAEAALAAGFEVMLHMPMESLSQTEDPGPGKISTAMDAAEIRLRTEEALASISGAVGVNNHTGSLFTADRLKMQEFLSVVQEKGLFYIDSRTHASTQGYLVAKEMGVLSAERDVFLDNERTREAILQQLEELIETARSQGQAIGIGHFYPETASVLAEAVPRLQSMGIQLVHASELVH